MFKLFRFLFFVSILFLYSVAEIQAQISSENAKFRHLSVNDGLSDNNVTAILQDKEGFIWLGTSDGLNKYDGYKFTVYRHNPNDTNSIGVGRIICIYEDSEGIIWIGAEGSLSKLNKKTAEFKVYKNEPQNSNSLSHNIVTDIKADKEGNMWIATYGGGINKFDKKTGKFKSYKYDPENRNSISSDYVESFFEDANGIIWIATFGGQKGGLNSFDKNSGKFTYHFANFLDNKKENSQLLRCIKEDEKGLIWMGNGTYFHGLTVYDKENRKISKQYENDAQDKHSLSNNFVECFYDDSKGHLWVGTQNGLNILDKNTGKFTVLKTDPNNPNSLSNNHITCIYFDNQGLMWVGTGQGGVNIYDKNSNNFIVFKNNPRNEKSLNNNQVNSIFEDVNGKIWMGTGRNGLSSFDKTSGEFKWYKDEIAKDGKKEIIGRVSSIQEINGQLWLGTFSSTIFEFDRSNNRYKPLPTLQSKDGKNEIPVFVFGLLADSRKTLWAATPACLFNLDLAQKKKFFYKNDPNDPNSISENFTYSVFEDAQNNVWVNTRSTGLNVFERSTGKFFCFKNDPKNLNSVNSNTINTIYQSQNGVLWIGTNGGGLDALILQKDKDKFSRGFKFYHFTDTDGLPNNIIAGILPDDNGNLWISTNLGLCKFTPPEYLLSASIVAISDTSQTGKAIFKNYDTNDGLPSNSLTGGFSKTKDGFMYFGSADGLVCFRPDSIKNNMHKPPVYFTSFKIFEKEFPLDTPVAAKREIILSYKQSFFSFEFVALDYAQPSKNQYAFKMEGFDNKWIYSGNRRYASYTNLDPGDYVFRVKASNNNGIWNENGTSIRIIITPPFWRTKLFYAICLLIIIFLAYSYIKWRERRLIEEKKLLEDQVAMRTKEVVEEKEKVELANTEIIEKNKKIESAYTIIEEKNHEITDSINYAKRIQQAILPDKKEMYTVLAQSFVLYKPKDIVSGDFYFFCQAEPTESGNVEKRGVFIAAVDCTGHGVPGAFMSMIGSEKLHDAVRQSNYPGEILALLNKGIRTTLHQSDSDHSTRDGMDIAFCNLDLENNKLYYAGANRPLLLIRKNGLEIEEIKATKNAIGGYTENEQDFKTHEIQLNQGDTFYIFTDGYPDQFGGANGKKFTTKKFKQMLLEIQSKSMQEQEKYLNDTINSWGINREQVDDILVMGIRV